MKGCAYCHRKFHKTEHLLRHQRSHTGEKPYRCSQCGRQYARSDVLLRHMKSFHIQALASNRETNPNLEGDPPNADETASTAIFVQNPRPTDDTAMQPTGPLELSSSLDLDALATISILQGRLNPDASVRPETSQCQTIDVASPPPVPSLDERSQHHQSPQISTPIPGMASSVIELAPNTSNNTGFELPGTTFTGSTEMMESHFMSISDNQFAHDHQLYTGICDLYGNSLDLMDLPASDASPSTALSSQKSSQERASNIPIERFAEVASLWPSNNADLANDFATSLWLDVAIYRGDNIYSDVFSSATSPTPTIGRKNESIWGMDEDKRQDLIREFVSDLGVPPRNRHGNMGNDFSSEDMPAVPFPPLRLLDLALDIAFRQPHTLIPFIHRPTFSAKSAPNSIVFALCLIGFLLLDSKQTRSFTYVYLPVAIEKCRVQLAQSPFGPGGTRRLITRLSTAKLLLISWSICRADTNRDDLLAQMLYNQMISLAQLSGLFVPRTDSLISNDIIGQAANIHAQDQSQRDDMTWKAWARVETVKRLITTLIMTDAWWTYSLGTTPLIRTHAVRLEMPCSNELFHCASAKSWKQLVDRGASIVTDTVTIQTHHSFVHLPETQPISPLSLIGLLSIIWIRILEVRARIIPPSTCGFDELYHVPETVYASDVSGKILRDTLNEIYVKSSSFFRFKNPNCISLWHFLNLNLVANLSIFELAAGCNGAYSAYLALQNISTWSQTHHARRACLHAAGIFTAMSRRRISDGTMFHSEVSLFDAALVLGLYVFMVQPEEAASSGPDVEPYELLNDVDWLGLGINSTGSPPTLAAGCGPGDASRRFLRDGGPISFSGVVCEGGYNAAKMILVEFSSLLEEVGKWNSKRLCHILKVMSESLLDIDDQARR